MFVSTLNNEERIFGTLFNKTQEKKVKKIVNLILEISLVLIHNRLFPVFLYEWIAWANMQFMMSSFIYSYLVR